MDNHFNAKKYHYIGTIPKSYRKIYKDTILQFIIKYQAIYSDFFYKFNGISSDVFKDCLYKYTISD